ANQQVISFHGTDGAKLLCRNGEIHGDQRLFLTIEPEHRAFEGCDPKRTERIFGKGEGAMVVDRTKVFTELKPAESIGVHSHDRAMLPYPNISIAIFVDRFGIVEWLIENKFADLQRSDVNAVVALDDFTEAKVA